MSSYSPICSTRDVEVEIMGLVAGWWCTFGEYKSGWYDDAKYELTFESSPDT